MHATLRAVMPKQPNTLICDDIVTTELGGWENHCTFAVCTPQSPFGTLTAPSALIIFGFGGESRSYESPNVNVHSTVAV